jgi:hypothetical protein
LPVVPFTPKSPDGPPQREPPSEGFALMAAAQMHKEGRLVQPKRFSDFRRSDDIEDRRKDPFMSPDRSTSPTYIPTDEPAPKNSNLSKKMGAAKLDAALLQKLGETNAQ